MLNFKEDAYPAKTALPELFKGLFSIISVTRSFYKSTRLNRNNS